MIESLVDSVQALASDSPLLLGAIALIVAFAAVSVVKFVVGLAIRVAMIGAVLLAALIAVGYLG